MCLDFLECETHFQNKKLEWKIIHYWVSSPTQIDKFWDTVGWGTSRSTGGGGTEAMASPKRQTREAKLCFGLPQTRQWVYLVSTESTDFTSFVT